MIWPQKRVLAALHALRGLIDEQHLRAGVGGVAGGHGTGTAEADDDDVVLAVPSDGVGEGGSPVAVLAMALSAGVCGAQPARPRPATAAMPTPALVMNCRRVYFPIFHSLVVGVFAPG